MLNSHMWPEAIMLYSNSYSFSYNKWMAKKRTMSENFFKAAKTHVPYYIHISLSIILPVTEIPGLICKL